MKLSDYIQRLQHLCVVYGNVDVRVMTCITHEPISGDGDFDCDEEYTKAVKPYYDKDNNCIVIHTELRDLSF